MTPNASEPVLVVRTKPLSVLYTTPGDVTDLRWSAASTLKGCLEAFTESHTEPLVVTSKRFVISKRNYCSGLRTAPGCRR